MHEALLYQKLDKYKVRCNVCHHRCLVNPGERGICGVRENQNGTLFALNYSLATAVAIDPIEKKPLFNFLPGTQTFSFAAPGCNFRCLNCQNFPISQITSYKLRVPQGQDLPPNKIIKLALQHNCPSISYTYTEPTIFLEYALDTMKLTKNIRINSSSICNNSHLKNIWVSNGYMTPETLELITPYLDAINVDLKSFSEKFYQQICGAHLQPVLDNLIQIHQNKIHLEITTLVIPGKNDSEQELAKIAEFIHGQLSPDVPWHVTAFYPTHKLLDTPPTPVSTIKKAQQIGKSVGLKYVYTGNI